MRELVAVLTHADTADAVLAAAALAAARLPGAAIAVLHPRRAADPSFLPTEEVMTPARQAHFAAGEATRSAAVRAAFDAWPGAAAATWREVAGDPAAIVAEAAGRADLLLIGRSADAAAIEAALFAAGAPLLLVPAAAVATLGRHIAVAWKPGATAERAVVAATPLLRAAEDVTVLIGGDAPADGPPDMLVQALGRAPRTIRFARATETIGAALLREAQSAGCDLLVMGAYAHRRATEALLGGATRDIIATGAMPVLLHH
jgi:nucleotide-binding universal stress UspA family protein